MTDRMGIDIWEVIAAASTKPFGFHGFLSRVPASVGTAFPIDPFLSVLEGLEISTSPPDSYKLAGESELRDSTSTSWSA